MKENHEKERGRSVLILGYTGGVGNVVVKKCFEMVKEGLIGRIIGAARNPKPEKYSDLPPFEQWQVDASDVDQLTLMLRKTKPDLLLNVGTPYWNLNIMEACLRTGTHYLDTACYEPENEARIRHHEQWEYHRAFRSAGLMALVGCGFDPGATNAMFNYAWRYHFSEIHKADILDCNGGDHGKRFASNFNLAVNLREVLGAVHHWSKGRWVETPRIIEGGAVHQTFDFEQIGPREMYLLSHEELESLVKNIPGIKQIRFWMTFGDSYLQCARALEEVGLTDIRKLRLHRRSMSPLEMLQLTTSPERDLIKKHEALLNELGLLSEKKVQLGDGEISPLEFLQLVLPDPPSLAEGYTGKTNISCIFEGLDKKGRPKRYRIMNICDHAECYKEVGSQAISYTTGVPAVMGAVGMVVRHSGWFRPGVYNVEQLRPNYLLSMIHRYGLYIVEQTGFEVPRLLI